MANYKYLDVRLVYDILTKKNIEEQYKKYGIADAYLQLLKFIEPGVELPATMPAKQTETLNVLYAGRGGTQKRVWLIDKIATHFIDNNLRVKFHFAGTMEDEVSEKVKTDAVMHGQVSDAAIMKTIYEQTDVILLTSAYEGFPMVIKEGMANGCIPVVTALEGNKTHLIDGQNSLLINNITDENAVVTEGVLHITKLMEDLPYRTELQHKAFNYAQKHFGKERFVDEYRKLLRADKAG